MPDSKKYPWVAVGLLWMVALLNYLDRQMLTTMRPSMEVDIHELKSATNFGYLLAIFLWIYAWLSPVSGMIADRFNKKRLIIGSLIVWSAVTLCMGFAVTFNQLYALRALMGISEAMYIPTALALIADLHTAKTRSLAIGIHMSGLYMGQALGGFGATIADSVSWQATFQLFGTIGILYAFVLLIFLKAPKKESISFQSGGINPPVLSNVFKGLNILVLNISFWVILFCFTIPSLPGWAIKNWLPTLFAQNLHIEMAYAGPLATITTAGSSLLGVIFGGFLADNWSKKTVKGRIYTAAIGLGLTIPALIFIGFGHTLFHIIGAAFCFGFGFGMFDANNMPILCQFVASRYRATAYGLMNFAGITAGAVITNMMGKSTDAGRLGSGFAVLSLFVTVAIVLQLFFLKPLTHDFKHN